MATTALSQTTLLAVPLAPLAGAVVAGLFGKVVGRRGAHLVTIAGVLVAFVLSAMVLAAVALDGARYNATVYEWMTLGDLKMEIGFMVDGLTAMMMCVVTFVSLMVHIYTIGYMADDPGYQRFFSYISLFTFSMLMLVMSNNFLQLFFGWEAVGPGVVPVDRLLVHAADGDLRQHEGLPRQPGRRLRLHPRHRPGARLHRLARLHRGLRPRPARWPS